MRNRGLRAFVRSNRLSQRRSLVEACESRRLLVSTSISDYAPISTAADAQIEVDGIGYYLAMTGDYRVQVIRTDGTAGGTYAVGGQVGWSYTQDAQFRRIGNSLYFLGDNLSTSGKELYQLDLQTQTTRQVTGLGGGNSIDGDLVTLGSKLYFRAGKPATGGELYTTDGVGNAQLVIDLYPGSTTGLHSVASIDGSLYLWAQTPNGWQFLLSDGTSAGTEVIRTFPSVGSIRSGFAETDNGVIFFVDGEVWVTDGTATGTQKLANTAASGSSVTVRPDPVSNGSFAVFQGHDGTMWRSDGTASGTLSLGISMPVFFASFPAVKGDSIYIPAGGLYRVTATGLTQMWSGEAGPVHGRETYYSYTAGDNIYFSGTAPGIQFGVGRSDGVTVDGAVLIDDQDYVGGGDQPKAFMRLGNRIVYGLADHLWSIEANAPALPSISGQVFNDVNANGVWDSGEPIETRARVFTDYNLNGDQNNSAGETPISLDSEGRFYLRYAPPRTFSIRPDPFQMQPYMVRSTPDASVTPVPGVPITNLLIGIHSRNTVSGRVVNDANGSSTINSGETGLAGVTVLADVNANGLLDVGEPTVLTDSQGSWSFADLPLGDYEILPVPPEGFYPSLPLAPLRIRATQFGLSSTSNNFAVSPVPSRAVVSGFVFIDPDADGVLDANESVTSGRTVWNDLDDDGVLDTNEPRANTTSNDGHRFILVVNPGVLRLRVQLTGFPGWITTNPVNSTIAAGERRHHLLLGVGVAPPSGNSVGGYVFNDLDRDGIRDSGENALTSYRVGLDLNKDGAVNFNEPTRQVDPFGFFRFNDLPAGTYDVRLADRARNFLQTVPANGAAVSVNLSDNASVQNLLLGGVILPDSELHPVTFRTFVDLNQDCVRQTNEPYQTDQSVLFDLNRDGIENGSDFRLYSTSSGASSTGMLAPGSYRTHFSLPSGWTITTPQLVSNETQVNGPVALDVGVYRPRAVASSPGYDGNKRQIRVALSSDATRFNGNLSTGVRVRSLATGNVHPASVTFVPADLQNGIGGRSVIQFGSFQSPLSLPDGRYIVEIDGALLAASDDATLPPSATVPFFVLRGDVTGNGLVDFEDLLVVAQHYGSSGRTYSQGNIDYSADGLVYFDDLLILAQQYGKSLSVMSLMSTASEPTAKRRKPVDEIVM